MIIQSPLERIIEVPRPIFLSLPEKTRALRIALCFLSGPFSRGPIAYDKGMNQFLKKQECCEKRSVFFLPSLKGHNLFTAKGSICFDSAKDYFRLRCRVRRLIRSPYTLLSLKMFQHCSVELPNILQIYYIISMKNGIIGYKRKKWRLKNIRPNIIICF